MEPTATECLNCGHRLQGPFCSECGQRVRDMDRPLRSLIGELLGEAFEADGRIVRTLVPLFARPGVLAQAFLAGKRRTYSSPLRVFLFVALVCFFGLSPAVETYLEQQAEADKQIVIAQLGVRNQFRPADDPSFVRVQGSDHEEQDRMFRSLEPEDAARLLGSTALGAASQAMLVAVPAFALLLSLVAWRKRILDQLIVSLNLHTVAILALTAIALVSAYVVAHWSIVLAGFLWVQWHVIGSLRRVYSFSWRRVAVVYAMLLVLYNAVVIVGVRALAALALQQL